MSIERRLKKTHATTMMSLYQAGQIKQSELKEVQAAIEAQCVLLAPVYGLDSEARLHVEVRGDGESYLVAEPKPAIKQDKTEEEEEEDDA